MSPRPGWEKFVLSAWFGTICPAGLAGNSFCRRPGLGQFVPRTWLGPICPACLLWDHLSRKPGLGRFVLQAWFGTTRPANLVWNNFVPQAWLQATCPAALVSNKLSRSLDTCWVSSWRPAFAFLMLQRTCLIQLLQGNACEGRVVRPINNNYFCKDPQKCKIYRCAFKRSSKYHIEISTELP